MLEQALGDGDALLGGGHKLATILGSEHALAQAVQGGVVGHHGLVHLVLVNEAQVLGRGKSRDAALDHGRGRLLDARDVACGKDARGARLAEVVHHGDLAALLAVVHDLATVHLEELGHGREANGHADGVDVKVLLGAGDKLEVAVHLGDGDAGHVVGAFGALDGVREVEGHAGAGNLRRVHAVAAHAGRRVDECHHVAAGLLELVAHDQANVARAEHEHALAGTHAVEVHHGLGGAGANDAGEGPALEGHHVLGGAGGNDDGVGLVVGDLLALADDDLLVLVEADDRGVKANVDAQARGLLHELLANHEAADLGVVLLRAEELVDLLKELAAGAGVLVEDGHVGAALCGLDCGGHAGRACSNDDNVGAVHRVPPFSSAVTMSSKGVAVAPYCVWTRMPSTRGVMQVRTLGTPSTTITQSVQRPMAQKMPRGSWRLAV